MGARPNWWKRLHVMRNRKTLYIGNYLNAKAKSNYVLWSILN
ncbi:hypothetical protein PQB34_gp31 [Ochrobactrum phage POI1126]|uniref:Uncharacterized protein n=1 Tax=Ochrobactrum phage POI1126 TaxID=1932118 RepID=A0A240F4T4_9CAUD|nr:hypothetical protein PQB34_gp31 [Ochrobactrum phage POI1126]APU92959.1 hypothetical protein POI1126_31 [Ochrobactrum phage POI1126]